jgi:hypothetical protein
MFAFRQRTTVWISLVLGLSFVSAAAAEPHTGRAPQRPFIATIAQVEEDQTPLPSSVATPIRRAQVALQTTKARFQRRMYGRALTSLKTVRINMLRAHRAGIAQMSAPPPPEEDTPPGPDSVIAVLNLEHGVSNAVVRLFNGIARGTVVRQLRYTLWLTHTTRNKMLDPVIATNSGEEGGDYSDGMADTVGIYTNEVNLVTRALRQYRLSPGARRGLRNALTRVRATEARVNAVFGGGE